jgi:hypothetical protein
MITQPLLHAAPALARVVVMDDACSGGTAQWFRHPDVRVVVSPAIGIWPRSSAARRCVG